MAVEFGRTWAGFRSMALTMFNFAVALALVSGERKMKLETARFDGEGSSGDLNLLQGALNFLWQSDKTGYHHVWPVSPHKNLYTSNSVDENKRKNLMSSFFFCLSLLIGNSFSGSCICNFSNHLSDSLYGT